MKITTIIIMAFVLNSFSMLGAQKEFLPLNGKYFDNIKVKIDTFITISHGNGMNDLPEIKKGSLFSLPEVFDVDEQGNLYLLFLKKLYKYNINSQLIKTLYFDGLIVDFKCYKQKLYLYDGKQLIILNADSFSQVDNIPLSYLNIKDYKIVNVSIFYDKYFFLRDENFMKGLKLRYIVDLEDDKIFPVQNDSSFCLTLFHCNNCDSDFLKKMFIPLSHLWYFGQSKRYIIYDYNCNRIESPHDCPDKTVREFYVYDKKNNVVSSLGETFNKTVGKQIFGMCSRPINFINDSTAIIQTEQLGKKVIYQKITIFPEQKN